MQGQTRPTDQQAAGDDPREATTSQPGRDDVADPMMGSGTASGGFASEESDDARDAPPDSNLKGSQDPSGGGMYPSQTGGRTDR